MRGITLRRGYRSLPMVLLAVAIGSGSAAAEPSDKAVASAKAAVAKLTPRDAGARYGQALGAIEVCVGTTLTEKASALGSVYTGADLEAFKAQSAKIYGAWIKVKHCVRQDDPNQCKVIMDESCTAAIAEIGPSGTALPGLLEPPRP
jgi:hypothetical protein